jgi:predicted DNA-binding transcriptional regulator AlpA
MTDPVFVDVKEAARLSSLSRATLYNLMAAQPPKLAFRKVGARRLIEVESLRKLGEVA